MNKSILILLISILTSACSTIERREYFSPSIQSAIGPDKPSCGFASFGGLPDAYEEKTNDNVFKITANQNFHPYTWGPWFAAVIPVFPLTWAAEVFVDDSLELKAYIKNIQLKEEKDLEYKINIKGKKELTPTNIETYYGNGYLYQTILFPIQYDEIQEFTLIIKSNLLEIQSIIIPFTKTSRWSWTQWTPNC